MSGRTRLKSKGRRGNEAEKFAYVPESVLRSMAGQTLPHAALKVLTILLVGRSRERNGTMCCSESYAAQFGVRSRDTVRRSLIELQQRGIIVVTRRVKAFKKWPTLFAVTWWPISYRDGEALSRPEDPTYDYLKWPTTTPATGVERAVTVDIPSHRWSDSLTPTTGVEKANHHTDGNAERLNDHTDDSGQSLDIPGAHSPSSSAPAVRCRRTRMGK
jgi:hypothetical protein